MAKQNSHPAAIRNLEDKLLASVRNTFSAPLPKKRRRPLNRKRVELLKDAGLLPPNERELRAAGLLPPVDQRIWAGPKK